ncbi:hypothetical protein [Kutzneria sp. 744]|uniref:hypothetical protein n=1 Tax=Kutzneria sp. (strain 744) TaxID=345341 RepID=UPI0003EEA606|nr:hypothetical protein [Kutzneria sp. 744]EWM19398.1 hypothetical protein KUTG_09702 [Kutzneria sp. 744]
MMLRTVIAGLKARPKRLLLSAVAIALGVAFLSGSLILADSLHAGVRAAVAYQLRGVDVDVTVKRGGDLDDAALNKLRQVPGVAAAEGRTTVGAPMLVDGPPRTPARLCCRPTSGGGRSTSNKQTTSGRGFFFSRPPRRPGIRRGST